MELWSFFFLKFIFLNSCAAPLPRGCGIQRFQSGISMLFFYFAIIHSRIYHLRSKYSVLYSNPCLFVSKMSVEKSPIVWPFIFCIERQLYKVSEIDTYKQKARIARLESDYWE